MKILFDNLLSDATLASVNASPNYPASNLIDGFLRVRYQVAAITDSLEITPSAAISMDSFFLGYIGNVSTINIEVYSGDTLQLVALGAQHSTGATDTVRVASTGGALMYFGAGPTDYFDEYAGLQFVSAHFDQISSVDKILVSFTGANPFYVGGVAAGLAVDMPAPDAAWEDTFEDNSIVVRSSHGQVQQQYIEPYKRFMFSFNGVSLADFTEIKAAALSVGSKPIWVTFFESSPTDYPPGYYSATLNNPQRDTRLYRFTMTFEEAR